MTFKPRIVTKQTALCLAALLGTACMAQAAQTQRTNRPPAEVVIPKSIFVTNDVAGKDPFFPNSTRPRLTDDSKKPGVGDPSPPLGADALRLLGITTDSTGKRIALINNLTFAQGEEHDVRVGVGRLKVRCIEIREKSVVVAVEGQSGQRELMLPEKILPTRRE
jgi:hypothetical protein